MPADQPQLLVVALDCARRGDFKAMSDICRHILHADPDQPDALHCMGLLQQRIGDFETAIQSHERAIHGRPDNAEYRHALALAYRSAGRIADAIEACEAAIRSDAGFVDAYVDLGRIFLVRGDHTNAISRLREAVERRPADPKLHVTLGKALAVAGNRNGAMNSFRRTIQMAPATGSAWPAIGDLELSGGDRRAGMIAFAEGIAQDPHCTGNYLRLAPLLLSYGETGGAIDCIRRGVALNPDTAALHVALARLLLRTGQYREAWPHYEKRLQLPPHASEMRRFVQPLWDGSDPTGMTLCVHCEPNAGETMLFLRYLEPLAERGARILLRCPPALRHLLAALTTPASVRGTDEALPPFDRQTWLGSLPQLLGMGDPAELAPTPPGLSRGSAVNRWSERCADLAPPIIGVHWRNASARALDEPHRLLEAMSGVEGSLIALQDRTMREEIETSGLLERVTQVGAGLEAGGDIVANIAAAALHCDIIVTVDSAIAHIAAALDRPTIVLINGSEDFWWPADRNDVPWYRSLHLHRRAEGETDTQFLDRLLAPLRE